MTVTIYQYPKCSTCRKALRWLEANKIPFKSVDIVVEPPSKKTLADVRKVADLPLGKLFNTSGESYRNGGFKDKLAKMSEDEALGELAKDGKLIKRPLVIGKGVALVGFDEAAWKKALG